MNGPLVCTTAAPTGVTPTSTTKKETSLYEIYIAGQKNLDQGIYSCKCPAFWVGKNQLPRSRGRNSIEKNGGKEKGKEKRKLGKIRR